MVSLSKKSIHHIAKKLVIYPPDYVTSVIYSDQDSGDLKDTASRERRGVKREKSGRMVGHHK